MTEVRFDMDFPLYKFDLYCAPFSTIHYSSSVKTNILYGQDAKTTEHRVHTVEYLVKTSRTFTQTIQITEYRIVQSVKHIIITNLSKRHSLFLLKFQGIFQNYRLKLPKVLYPAFILFLNKEYSMK